ncbi:MAG: hypothetical protein RMI91_13330 [Gemmatales bacterium]|nr:hypothetical protein [Gemmatales bacterium]MDW7995627.1 hypothetical protein [Gemmatales bacterium]
MSHEMLGWLVLAGYILAWAILILTRRWRIIWDIRERSDQAASDQAQLGPSDVSGVIGVRESSNRAPRNQERKETKPPTDLSPESGSVPREVQRSGEPVATELQSAGAPVSAAALEGQREPERGEPRQTPARPTNRFFVELSDSGVSVIFSDGTSRSVAWDDLQRVEIVTTDQGPFLPDVFFVLYGSATKCIVPQGIEGDTQLLERLQRLPGFRNEAVIEAMCCPTNRRFLCWERAPRGDA